MLIAYQIQLTICQSLVRCNIIREFHNLYLQATFGCFLGCSFYNLSMRTGGSTNLNRRLSLLVSAAAACCRQCHYR